MRVEHAGEHVEHELTDLGAAEVEHQLLPLLAPLAVGLVHHPIGVRLVELRPRVHHLRLQPDAEADALLRRSSGQGLDAAGQLPPVDHPVTQPGVVGVTWVPVTEPAVVEEEHLGTQLGSIADHAHELLLVELEERGLPVVEDHRPRSVAVADRVGAHPAVQPMRERCPSLPRPRPHHRRTAQLLAGIEHHLRAHRVPAAQRPDLAHRVPQLERQPHVAAPRERTGEHLTGVLGRRLAHRQEEERVHLEGRADAAVRLDQLRAGQQPLLVGLPLLGPAAAVVSEPGVGAPPRGRSSRHLVDGDRPGLAVARLDPLLDHTVVVPGPEPERDLQTPRLVTQADRVRGPRCTVEVGPLVPREREAGDRVPAVVGDPQRRHAGEALPPGGHRQREDGEGQAAAPRGAEAEPGLVDPPVLRHLEAIAGAAGGRDLDLPLVHRSPHAHGRADGRCAEEPLQPGARSVGACQS